jgi:hypothetical protein
MYIKYIQNLRSVLFGLLYSTVRRPKRHHLQGLCAPVASVFVTARTARVLVFISMVTSIMYALSR